MFQPSLTGLFFFTFEPGGAAFFAPEDDGCIGAAIGCECIADGAGTDAEGMGWDVFCLLRAEVVGLGTGSCKR